MTHDQDDADEEMSLDELALWITTDLQPSVTPPPTLRRTLIEAAGSEPFRFVLASEGEWRAHPVPGIRVKTLSRNAARGYAMLLLHADAGAEFPAHTHSGAEECLVLQGDVTIGGRTLHPGDFHHASAYTTHSPVTTQSGCIVLLVVDAQDYPG